MYFTLKWALYWAPIKECSMTATVILTFSFVVVFVVATCYLLVSTRVKGYLKLQRK